MNGDRFDRNIRLFGEEGQARLRQVTCAVVGAGGLGTQTVQNLTLLGVGGLNLIDGEEVDDTNRNRYVGLYQNDPVPGTRKVAIAERMILAIDPTIRVRKVFDSFVSADGYAAIREADYVFGCLDSEGARLILTEVCAAYSRPYIDLASDIIPGDPAQYGGRVCAAIDGNGCLVCLDVLDRAEAGRELGGQAEQRNRDKIYGVNKDILGDAGPSIVSVNGVIASLAVTEFMVAVTGLRPAKRLLTYYGATGKVTVSLDTPHPDCYYCKGLWGRGPDADVERYIRRALQDRNSCDKR